MLAVLLGSASIVSLIAARLYGTPGGLLAGLVFLTAPVTLRFSFVAVPVNLSLLFLLLALYFATLRHERRENRLTLLIATFGCFYLAVLTTWEAALAVPGFVIGAWLAVDRQSRLPALGYAGAALLALITIFCIYFISRPDQLQELWHVVRYRAGIDEYQPTHLTVYQIEKAVNLVPDDKHWMALRVAFVFVRRLQIFGQLALAFLLSAVFCLIWFKAERTRLLLITVAPLTSAWLLWALLMPNHYVVHEFQAVLGLPAISLAAGWIYAFLNDQEWNLSEHTPRIALGAALSLAVPLALLAPLADRAFSVHTKTDWQIGMDAVRYGRDIGVHTPNNAVILQPSITMVPVYYSGRHTVRGVNSDLSLSKLRGILGTRFPKQDIFLAITPEEKARFPEAIMRYPLVATTPTLLLFHLIEHPDVK